MQGAVKRTVVASVCASDPKPAMAAKAAANRARRSRSGACGRADRRSPRPARGRRRGRRCHSARGGGRGPALRRRDRCPSPRRPGGCRHRLGCGRCPAADDDLGAARANEPVRAGASYDRGLAAGAGHRAVQRHRDVVGVGVEVADRHRPRPRADRKLVRSPRLPLPAPSSTETLEEPELATAMSGWEPALESPTATERGSASAAPRSRPVRPSAPRRVPWDRSPARHQTPMAMAGCARSREGGRGRRP
jgi:hypothetical protein